MEFITGLGLLGNYFNNSKKETSKIKRNNISKINSTGDNIYDSNDAIRFSDKYKNVGSDRYKKGLNTMESGIVPDFYNQVFEHNKKEQKVIILNTYAY